MGRQTSSYGRHQNLPTAWQSRSVERLEELSEPDRPKHHSTKRKGEKSKEVADVPLSKIRNDMSSNAPRLVSCLKVNRWMTVERRGGARMGLIEYYDTILNRNLNFVI